MLEFLEDWKNYSARLMAFSTSSNAKGEYIIQMKTTDIAEVIANYMNSEEGLSILIEGECGCGKTYNVQECLKKLSNKHEIFYMSFSIGNY